jgi:fructose-bisphosphate aldolase class I
MLKTNKNMIAGFGRAFMEGMTVRQSSTEFSKIVEQSCKLCFSASKVADAQEEQMIKITEQTGFFVGLDQDASVMANLLKPYGITPDHYSSEVEMMEKAHQLRTRIITNQQFNGSRCIAVIMTDDALASNIGRLPSARYLWEVTRIVPFVKLDKGLAYEEAEGVRMMKEVRDLNQRLDKAVAAGIRGTITRTVVKAPISSGIQAVVNQQLEMAKQVLQKGLVPIVQIEVDKNSPDKGKSERLLANALRRGLDDLNSDQRVILDVTLPNVAGTYKHLVQHPNVLRILALSGGYCRVDACKMLEQNEGMIASWGRAFTEGLHISQTEKEFTNVLMESCKLLYHAASRRDDVTEETIHRDTAKGNVRASTMPAREESDGTQRGNPQEA